MRLSKTEVDEDQAAFLARVREIFDKEYTGPKGLAEDRFQWFKRGWLAGLRDVHRTYREVVER